HALPSFAFTKRHRELVAHCLPIDAVDVAPSKYDGWLVTFEREVHQHIIEHLLDVGAVDTSSKVIGCGAPMDLCRTVDATKHTNSWVGGDECSQTKRIGATADCI